ECNATGPMPQEIKPWYRITNKGTSAQALAEITVRYWYNVDASSGSLPQEYVCDYAQVDVVGGSTMAITPDVMATFGAAPTPNASADSYMEISFSAGAGSIPPGLTAQIQNRFHKSNYSGMFTQTGDYSFNSAATAFTPSTAITLYRSGKLVWGVEPGGMAGPGGDPQPSPELEPMPSLSANLSSSARSAPPRPISSASRAGAKALTAAPLPCASRGAQRPTRESDAPRSDRRRGPRRAASISPRSTGRTTPAPRARSRTSCLRTPACACL